MNIFIFQDVDGETCAINNDFVTGLSTALNHLVGIFHSHIGSYFRIYDTINKDFIYIGDITPNKMQEIFGEILTCQILKIRQQRLFFKLFLDSQSLRKTQIATFNYIYRKIRFDFSFHIVYNMFVRLREMSRAAPFSIRNRYRTRRKENRNANTKKRTEKIFSEILKKLLTNLSPYGII